MNALKTFLFRIGHYLFRIIRSLRNIICCRKRKGMEYVLPMTIEHVTELKENRETLCENSDFKYQWETWPGNKSNNLNTLAERTDSDIYAQALQTEVIQEDYFKDMVPQIRKQKKVLAKNTLNDQKQDNNPSNRLAMDPSRVFVNPDLGVIDDNPCNWENSDDSEQLWDPEALIREKKRAEQEKRREEHQRRKQEKENRKTSKPESLSNMMLSLSDSKDKHKYS